MHVEFRLCEVEQACVFDTQSFYRMKQLLANHSGTGGGDDESVKRTTSPESMLRIGKRTRYTPQLKLQLVVERLVEMESLAFSVCEDKRQHEAKVRSNWNNSAVGTAYHSAAVDEVILAALPLAAADSVVKIRLLQLPPPLDYDAQQAVKKAIGNTSVPESRHDTPLCIGVAKITLRELMSARRTVSIAMQAKRTIVSTVEGNNLDTLITNAMFGKGESTGSALLSIQINGFTFGRVPKGKLLGYKEPSDLQNRHGAPEADTRSIGMRSTSSAGTADNGLDVETESLNSPAIRFVLIPYVAFLDVLLRISDVASWRVPRKSGMAFAIVLVALYADLFDVMFILMVTLCTLLFLRNISLFYCVPLSDPASRAGASAAMPSGVNNFQPFLYSRENPLLNSLLRARVFFARGLLEDAYFELALSAHLARHFRRQIAAFTLAVCAGFVCLSMGTVIILLTLAIFTLYPVYLNTSLTRRPRRRRMALGPLLRALQSALRLPHRFRVVRVVHVAVVRSKAASPQPDSDSIKISSSEVVQQQFLSCIRQRTDSIGAGSVTDLSEASQKGREGSAMGTHRRARTMDPELLASNPATFSSTLDHFQLTHVMRYFVALCFSPAGTDLTGFASTTGGLRKPQSNTALQRRMTDQLRQAKSLSAALAAEFPQANSMSAAGSSAFAPQPSVLMADSKPPALSKELQETFHTYFNSTIGFLCYLRQQTVLHSYVTQSSMTRCVPDSMRSLSVLAQTQGLVEVGEDDGVTKAIVGRRAGLGNVPVVGKFNTSSPVEVTGRVMALYAAYLLQGARLSIYISASGCSTLVPLLAPGDRIERFPQPNPCPPDLLNTLDSVWRGETNDTPERGKEVFFTADAVIQIITVYKNFWTGDGVSPAARTPSRFDSTGGGDCIAASPAQRNPIRNVFASLAPNSRHLMPSRSATTYLTRSPRAPASPGMGLNATTSAASFQRADAAATTRGSGPGSPGLAPLHLPPAATMERATTNIVSDTTGSAELNHSPSVAIGEPPLLEATVNGESRGQSMSLEEKDSPDPKLSNTLTFGNRPNNNSDRGQKAKK